jgi:hypothetical protein
MATGPSINPIEISGLPLDSSIRGDSLTRSKGFIGTNLQRTCLSHSQGLKKLETDKVAPEFA